MVKKKVIRDELIIIKLHVLIRVKEAIANIIKKGIIASAKHSLKQVIKDQMILW